MKISVTALAGLSLLVLAAADPAAAKLVTISGSGVWANNSPTTAYSAPGDSYFFTFQVEQTYPVSYSDTHLKQTTSFQSYQYDLNGVVVAGLPINITFFDAHDDGGLALSYSDHSVEFIGPDIGSSGTVNLFQNVSFYPNIDYTTGDGGGIINEGSAVVSAVPEPAAWILSLVGFGAVGGMTRSRRRASAPVVV
jgi:hypothetical protein